MKQTPERRVGLARALSKLGLCSRSQAGQLVRAGRVRVNGQLRRDPEFGVRLGRDRIEVDREAAAAAEKIYLVLNKPRGVVTTAADEKGRDTIYSCLPREHPWVAPVGRLDKASEGLLLLTNDSEWSARVLAPETHLAKIYHVQIRAQPDATLLKILREGVRSDGDFLAVREAAILRQGKRNAWLEIILDEGKNRHIRRMLKELGIEVVRLIRIVIGPLPLGNLEKGKFRPLTQTEKRELDRAMKPQNLPGEWLREGATSAGLRRG